MHLGLWRKYKFDEERNESNETSISEKFGKWGNCTKSSWRKHSMKKKKLHRLQKFSQPKWMYLWVSFPHNFGSTLISAMKNKAEWDKMGDYAMEKDQWHLGHSNYLHESWGRKGETKASEQTLGVSIKSNIWVTKISVEGKGRQENTQR